MLAPQHVIAQEPGVDQGHLMEICHALGPIQRQEPVKVRSLFLKIVFCIVQTFSFQLRGLGNYGAHGELALVPVTTQQPGVEQEASMVARCHAQAVGQMWAVAQVRHIL